MWLLNREIYRACRNLEGVSLLNEPHLVIFQQGIGISSILTAAISLRMFPGYPGSDEFIHEHF